LAQARKKNPPKPEKEKRREKLKNPGEGKKKGTGRPVGPKNAGISSPHTLYTTGLAREKKKKK